MNGPIDAVSGVRNRTLSEDGRRGLLRLHRAWHVEIDESNLLAADLEAQSLLARFRGR